MSQLLLQYVADWYTRRQGAFSIDYYRNQVLYQQFQTLLALRWRAADSFIAHKGSTKVVTAMGNTTIVELPISAFMADPPQVYHFHTDAGHCLMLSCFRITSDNTFSIVLSPNNLMFRNILGLGYIRLQHSLAPFWHVYNISAIVNSRQHAMWMVCKHVLHHIAPFFWERIGNTCQDGHVACKQRNIWYITETGFKEGSVNHLHADAKHGRTVLTPSK